jgi:RNA polymerase sigma-70 factor, ECF subfamily
MTSAETDMNLIMRMTSGDDAAFDELFRRHFSGVRSRILRIVHDAAAAEDLVQEVFLRLWTRSFQWQGIGSLAGWLNRIAINLSLNHLRTAKRIRVVSEPVTVNEDGEEDTPGIPADTASLRPDRMLERVETAAHLQSLLDRLPMSQQTVIRMVHEAEMDIEEVAVKLKIPPGTVKSRLHYARVKITRHRNILEEEF